MLLMAFLTACSSHVTSARDAADANDTGRRLAPTNEGERKLLQALAALPNGKEQRVGADTVVAEAPYEAASGRTCRALSVTLGATRRALHRLACSDGRGWFFVPDVFGSNAAAE
jgi:hypothetical protein